MCEFRILFLIVPPYWYLGRFSCAQRRSSARGVDRPGGSGKSRPWGGNSVLDLGPKAGIAAPMPVCPAPWSSRPTGIGIREIVPICILVIQESIDFVGFGWPRCPGKSLCRAASPPISWNGSQAPGVRPSPMRKRGSPPRGGKTKIVFASRVPPRLSLWEKVVQFQFGGLRLC